MGYLRDMLTQLKDNQRVIFVGTGIIIVNDDNRVLLGKRTDNSEWCLPGGSLELNESLEECIVREAREETGIIIDTADVHLNAAKVIKNPVIKDGKQINIVSISYWCNKYSDIDFIMDSREFSIYSWFSKDEVYMLNSITEYSLEALNEFYKRKD